MRLRSLVRGGSLRSGLTLTLTLLAVVAGPVAAYIWGGTHYAAQWLRTGLRAARGGGRSVRLYLFPAARDSAAGQGAAQDANYIEVAASSVLRVEQIPDPPAPPTPAAAPLALPLSCWNPRGLALLRSHRLRWARCWRGPGRGQHRRRSAGQCGAGGEQRQCPRRLPRRGRGLMQLMPGTATELGVPQLVRAGGEHRWRHGLSGRSADALPRRHRAVGCGIQRGAGGSGPVPRHSALRRDASVCGAGDPRVQPPQARRAGEPDGGRKVDGTPKCRTGERTDEESQGDGLARGSDCAGADCLL